MRPWPSDLQLTLGVSSMRDRWDHALKRWAQHGPPHCEYILCLDVFMHIIRCHVRLPNPCKTGWRYELKKVTCSPL